MKIVTGLFVATIFTALSGCSQTRKIENGYAYSRTILGGIKPKVSVAEDGTVIQKSKEPGVEYLIYLSTKHSSFLQVQNAWIKGKKYNAHAEAVNELPAIIKKDTLFIPEKYYTWKVIVGKKMPSDNTSEKLKETGEIVIGFLSKGSQHYFAIAKIKDLEPLRLE
ncbi:MAG: hypothetical protein ABI691_05775 [Ginsengibacter sp.]